MRLRWCLGLSWSLHRSEFSPYSSHLFSCTPCNSARGRDLALHKGRSWMNRVQDVIVGEEVLPEESTVSSIPFSMPVSQVCSKKAAVCLTATALRSVVSCGCCLLACKTPGKKKSTTVHQTSTCSVHIWNLQQPFFGCICISFDLPHGVQERVEREASSRGPQCGELILMRPVLNHTRSICCG